MASSVTPSMKHLNVSPRIAAMNKALLGKHIPVPQTLLQEIFYLVYQTIDPATVEKVLAPFKNEEKRIRIESLLFQFLGPSPREWQHELLKSKYRLKEGEIGQLWPNKSVKRSNEEAANDFFSCFRAFAPIQDKDMGMEQLLDCMRQYNSNEFLFCGFAWPNHLWNPKGLWSVPDPIPKKNAYGFLINTSSGTGSHWIGLYCYFEVIPPANYQGKEITILQSEYFDSFGLGPIPAVQEVVSQLYGTISELIRPYDMVKTRRSAKQLQFVGLECGVYAVHFLASRIRGISFDDFMSANNRPDDVMMKKLRSTYWNLYTPSL